MNEIEHVVVLMLENRSFDSMLGWLYEHDDPAVVIPPAAPGDEFRGLQSIDPGQFENRASNGSTSLSSPPCRGVAGLTVPAVDPGEEFEHVNTQFFQTQSPEPGATATMTGVLEDYVDVLTELDDFSAQEISVLAPMIMGAYTPGQLPVLNQLAKHYAVSDDWFASVPSQTNPNRAFLMSGTSHGLVNNGELESNPQAKVIEDKLGMKIGDDRFPDPTIFNALEEAGEDWKVYWQTSYLPEKISKLLDLAPDIPRWSPNLILQALRQLLKLAEPYSDYLHELSSGTLESSYTWRLFTEIRDKIPSAKEHFAKVDAFFDDARAGNLPKFSYLEPFWTISQTGANEGLKRVFTALGNDYHPPGNVLVPERFVADVYRCLIANKEAWEKTLLVITFDEFVGTFDHVSPPAAVPPWGVDGAPPFQSETGFGFDRYGGRVPSILVSPWVEKGTVFRRPEDVPYDHTSVIASTLKWLGRSDAAEHFGERVKQAPTFDNVLTRSAPRVDAESVDFLRTTRAMHSPVSYGDRIVLKTGDGYIAPSKNAPKAVSVLPSSMEGIGVDVGLRAFFPTFSGGAASTLAFHTEVPDPGQLRDGDTLWLTAVDDAIAGADNFLGAWGDSRDCYYYDAYLHGPSLAKQQWVLKKENPSDPVVSFGDRIRLVNVHYEQGLVPKGGWLTTAAVDDWWSVLPAETFQFFLDNSGQNEHAQDVCSGPSDMSWFVNTAGQCLAHTAHIPGGFQVVSSSPPLARIAVGAKDLPWAVTTDGQVVRRTGDSLYGDVWSPVAAVPAGAQDIGVGADGTPWVTTTEGHCLRWDGENVIWTLVSSEPELQRIAVGPEGLPWAVTASGQIVQRHGSSPTGDTWLGISGTATDIGVAGDGTAWHVNSKGDYDGVWRWDGSTWQLIETATRNVAVAGHYVDGRPVSGTPTLVTTNHKVGNVWARPAR